MLDAIPFFNSPFSYYVIAVTVAFTDDAIKLMARKAGGQETEEKLTALQKTDTARIIIDVSEMGIRSQFPTDALLVHDVVKGGKEGIKEALAKNRHGLFSTKAKEVVKEGIKGAAANMRVSSYLSVPLLGGLYRIYSETRQGYARGGFWGALDKGTDALGYCIPGGATIMNNLDRQERAVARYTQR